MVVPLLPAPGGDGEEALARLAFTHPRLLVGGVEVGEAEPPRGGADVGDGAGEARELAADAAAYELGSRGGGGGRREPLPPLQRPLEHRLHLSQFGLQGAQALVAPECRSAHGSVRESGAGRPP